MLKIRIIVATQFQPSSVIASITNSARLKNTDILVGLWARVIESIREGCNMAIHPYVRDTPLPRSRPSSLDGVL